MLKTVVELVPPGKPLNKTNDSNLPVAPPPTASPVACGYIIGFQENGELLFEIIGTQPGIVQLLGLNTLVREHLQGKVDEQLGGKFSNILNKLNQVLERLKE